MGVRTVHQQEAKAQLLVAVGRQPANPWTAAQVAGALPDQAEPQADIEAAANEKVGAVLRLPAGTRHRRRWAGPTVWLHMAWIGCT